MFRLWARVHSGPRHGMVWQHRGVFATAEMAEARGRALALTDWGVASEPDHRWVLRVQPKPEPEQSEEDA